MKRLFILILLFNPVYIFAQQQVVLKSGVQFEAYIRGVLGKDLIFYNEVKEIDSKKVDIMLIHSISGEISKTTITKALTEKNTEIIFISTYTPIEQDGSLLNSTALKTPGDLIKHSSMLRLTGFTLAGATTISYYAGAFEKLELKEQKAILILSASVSLLLYIAGEFEMYDAGKALKRGSITITPASQGIGLAINF